MLLPEKDYTVVVYMLEQIILFIWLYVAFRKLIYLTIFLTFPFLLFLSFVNQIDFLVIKFNCAESHCHRSS